MACSDACDRLPTAVKVLIAGGFGVGKTTFTKAISEIEPLTTEELITAASARVDSLDGVTSKTATTVAFDFGRITLARDLVLYLFGTPGQERFWFMWDELSTGALGAIALADTRRLEDCFEAVDFFESRQITFIVAVNQFPGAFRYTPDEVRAALGLKPGVPVTVCDARDTRSATHVLLTLTGYLIGTTSTVNPARQAPGHCPIPPALPDIPTL